MERSIGGRLLPPDSSPEGLATESSDEKGPGTCGSVSFSPDRGVSWKKELRSKSWRAGGSTGGSFGSNESIFPGSPVNDPDSGVSWEGVTGPRRSEPEKLIEGIPLEGGSGTKDPVTGEVETGGSTGDCSFSALSCREASGAGGCEGCADSRRLRSCRWRRVDFVGGEFSSSRRRSSASSARLLISSSSFCRASSICLAPSSGAIRLYRLVRDCGR